jgi:hypothetical protein
LIQFTKIEVQYLDLERDSFVPAIAFLEYWRCY